MSKEDGKISLDTAQTWTKEWRDDESEYNKYNECNAFLVPVKDFQGVLNEIADQGENAYVRCYLGVKKTYDPDTQGNTFEEKLIIVGTEPARNTKGDTYYKDLLPPPGDLDLVGGPNSIWDFSTPCPPSCDPTSELY